jgi:hypothetical protein
MKSEQIKSLTRARHMRTRSVRDAALMAIVAGILVLIPATLLILTACSTVSPPPPAEAKTSVASRKACRAGSSSIPLT